MDYTDLLVHSHWHLWESLFPRPEIQSKFTIFSQATIFMHVGFMTVEIAENYFAQSLW